MKEKLNMDDEKIIESSRRGSVKMKKQNDKVVNDKTQIQINKMASELVSLIEDNSSQTIKDQKAKIIDLENELSAVATEIHNVISTAKGCISFYDKNNMSIAKLQAEEGISVLTGLKSELRNYCPYLEKEFEHLEESEKGNEK